MNNGPTLGVLGGLGPAAGVEFMRLFTDGWPATRDQDHPRVILLSEPAIPDRTAALRGVGPDPTPHLSEALNQLAVWGADLLAVPCNTAFAFIDDFPATTTVPVVHTVAVTLDAAQVHAPTGAWLLATDGCLISGGYQRHADERGYPVREPNPGAARQVHECIEMAKAGRLADATRLFDEVLDGLPDAWPPLLACTELADQAAEPTSAPPGGQHPGAGCRMRPPATTVRRGPGVRRQGRRAWPGRRRRSGGPGR
ncbi:aspartate racemase [Kibdelosporangium lantanae]